jgi:hypothetical protein
VGGRWTEKPLVILEYEPRIGRNPRGRKSPMKMLGEQHISEYK